MQLKFEFEAIASFAHFFLIPYMHNHPVLIDIHILLKKHDFWITFNYYFF